MAVADQANVVAAPGQRVALLGTTSAMGFVVLLGTVSLFSDATYEGARSLNGQYLNLLGAGAAAVGIAAGAGELLGYSLRLVSGYVADCTRRYWAVTIAGYAINLLAVPCLALAGRWELAVGLMFAERIGKAIRNPSRDAMLSYATTQMGRGWGFGPSAFHWPRTNGCRRSTPSPWPWTRWWRWSPAGCLTVGVLRC